MFELPTGNSIEELCAGRIDASILIVGHPNAAVGSALAGCGATLVPVRGPKVDEVLSANSEYVATAIPQATYPELTADIPTYSVMATIVTRAEMADEIVEALVASTLASLPELAMRAPVLEGLDPAEDARHRPRRADASRRPPASSACWPHAARMKS